MARMATQSQSLPRFLLPTLTWKPTPVKTVLLGSLDRKRAYGNRVNERRPRQLERGVATQPVVRRPHLRSLYEASKVVRTFGISPQFVQKSQKKSILQNDQIKRAFHATPHQSRDHHFDTLKFVQRLKEEGFSEDQAVAMMRVLSDVIEESIQNLTRTMVLREDQEKATYTQKVDFAKLRSELLSSDNTESSLTRASHERLTNDLAKLNSRLRDEISRTQASVRLDLNLEKGRIREEANVQELKIKETETRIEQEVAGLKERVESVKFSTLQWLM
ncbi:MAG: hypothetical protein M1827_002999 [Pycnora praestabilis]|nr:MAG: hypothetical protein M1827_002999 [Pycnora praestabilis]